MRMCAKSKYLRTATHVFKEAPKLLDAVIADTLVQAGSTGEMGGCRYPCAALG